MSAVDVSHKVTPRLGALQKNRVRPERTAVTQLFQQTENVKDTGEPGSPKVSQADNPVMSLELLSQYNGIVKTDDSLAFKPLPPVKVSYQSNKKFTETPRGETSSRIIHPQLTLKTYAPGHHIFTEGISRNSEMPSPTFALEKIGVPYSNLPESISIFKEKDKFAFGLRPEDVDKSPYRLSPRPTIMGTAQILNPLQKVHVPTIEVDDYNSEDSSRELKAKTNRSSVSMKSNLVKLQPLTGRDNGELLSYASNLGPVKEPLGPVNSSMSKENDSQEHENVKDSEFRPEKKTERKLSVISVGESLAVDFHERSKREARQTYPMYNNRSRKIEEFHRDKFGHQERYRAKPRVPNSTFTYKVSTRGLTFVDDSNSDKFKPIKNNIKDKNGKPISTYRGMVHYSEDADSMHNSSNDYSFRRYHSQSFHLPKSAGSGSTDMTHLPGNPPPSETSHQISEDFGAPQTLLVNDLRSGMVTLHEERTMTSSLMGENDRRLVNSVAEINPPVPEVDYDAEKDVDTSRTAATFTTTDTDMQYQAVLRHIEDAKAAQRGNTSQTNYSGIFTAQTNPSRGNTAQTKTNASRTNTSKTNVSRNNTAKAIASRNNTAQTNVSRITIGKTESGRNNTAKSNNSRINTGQTNVSRNTGATLVSNGKQTDTSSVGKLIIEAEERIKQERLGDLVEADHKLEQAEIIWKKVEPSADTGAKCDSNKEGQSFNQENDANKGKIETSAFASNETPKEDLNKSVTVSEKTANKIPSKQCLNVPKLSFEDSLSWHPALPNIGERTTSLSRKIQNMSVVNKFPTASEQQKAMEHVRAQGKNNVASVPITHFRLFSAASSTSVSVPSVFNESRNANVKYDVVHDARDEEPSPEDEDRLEPTMYMSSTRRVLSKANISFIYPCSNEVKAKRQ